MNIKLFISILLFLCLTAIFPDTSAGRITTTALTVKEIIFTHDKKGNEKIAIFCNRRFAPNLFSLEGENLRVVVDIAGVSRIQAKARNVIVEGKSVKRVRSYLDKQKKMFRVVMDMEPSKFYVVRPIQNLSYNIYALKICEVASLQEQKPEENKSEGGTSPAQEKHISFLFPGRKLEKQVNKLTEVSSSAEKPESVQSEIKKEGSKFSPQEKQITAPFSDFKPEEQKDKLTEVSPSQGKLESVKNVNNALSIDIGRSQLNACEYAAAIDTFTRLLAVNPQDRMCYRLRGNAYDNLGNRKKALEDYVQAARLGDTILQSYLDFLQANWRENPSP